MKKFLTILALILAAAPALAQYEVVREFQGRGYLLGEYGGQGVYSDGTKLYGTAYQGGADDLGVVFSMDLDGSNYEVLHEFTGGVDDGEDPRDGLIVVGNYLYGTTRAGGDNNIGILYKIEKDGDNFEILHEFQGGVGDGSEPWSRPTFYEGYLYGVTYYGGDYNFGVVYKIDTLGNNYSLLREFTGVGDDGKYPMKRLSISNGMVYGSTYDSRSGTAGIAYKMDTTGGSFTTLRVFMGGGSDGNQPISGVNLSGGYLYGITSRGGDSNVGVIYKLDTDGNNFSLMHEFSGGTDGEIPWGDIFIDGSYLYGTALNGGSYSKGVVYRINLDGSGYNLLHAFEGGDSDGSFPYGGIYVESGYVYGTTNDGGDNNKGAVFKMATGGANYELIHEFGYGAYGRAPQYTTMASDDSAFYGVTYDGGHVNAGLVYKVDKDDSDFSVLHEFLAGGDDGSDPRGIAYYDGYLYGLTYKGGDSDIGTLYKIGVDGNNFTLLHEFAGTGDGAHGRGSVIISDGYIYGMNVSGNSYHGVVFKVGVDGSNYTRLHGFNGGASDGDWPQAGLILSDGYLYGTTYSGGDSDLGVVFKIDTDGNNFALLHEFSGGANDGQQLNGNLIIDGSTLYGMTTEGGDSDLGTIFKIDTDGGNYAILHEFSGGANDGASPYGGLTMYNGKLYGVTYNGGDSDLGVIFKIDTDGNNFALLHEFSGGSNGEYPRGNSLKIDGTYLYGLTQEGGDYDAGVIFKYSLAEEPTVTTTAVSGISATEATSGGNVTADGGASVTARGVCWNTSGTATLADSYTSDGSGTGTYTSSLSGLDADAQYYVRAYATNSVGTGYGSEESFRTLANVPGAPSLNASSATTIDISLDVNGNPANTEFAVQETGSTNYVQGDGSLGASEAWQIAATWGTFTATGLSVDTEYELQIKARNGDATETAFGTSASVYTHANAPGAPTVDNPSSSSLDITLDVNGNPANTEFAIQETSSGDYVQSDGSLGASEAWQTAATWGTKSVSCASPNAIYTFQVKARNGDGAESAFSGTTSDRTLAAVPGAPTAHSSDETTIDLSLAANGNPAHTEFAIQETGSTNYVQGDGSLGASEAWQTAATWGTFTVTGLSPDTEYTFHAKARNADGDETAFGPQTSYSTQKAAPIVTTNAATGASVSAATLNGVVTANGYEATVKFEYGTSPAYGSEITTINGSPVAAGGSNVSCDASISGLSGNTTYHYRIVATNSQGTSYGSNVSFTTNAGSPNITTLEAEGNGAIAKTLRARASANGSSTTVTFEYGTTVAYGNTLSDVIGSPLDSDENNAIVEGDAENLTPETTYHYRAIAENAIGQITGSDMTFTTAAEETYNSMVRGFSTDPTLGDNSDDYIPTQRAIKAYLNEIVPAGGAEGQVLTVNSNGEYEWATVSAGSSLDQMTTATISSSGNVDDYDVSNIDVIFCNASGIVFRGLSGGTSGQTVYILNTHSGVSVSVKNEDAAGSQKFSLPDGSDMTLTNRKGAQFIYNGSMWYMMEK